MERFVVNGKKKKLISEEEYIILQDFKKRKTYFVTWLKNFNINKICCVSCAFPTITRVNSFEICLICSWEENSYGDDELLWHNHSADEPLTLLDYRLINGREFSMNTDNYSTSAYFKFIMKTIETFDKKYTELLNELFGKNGNNNREEINERISKFHQDLLKNINI